MAELHELDGVEQARLVKAGEISSRELVDHYLNRIATYDPKIKAFVTVSVDETVPPSDGPLAGVPTAIKDLTPTKGIRTSFGSKAFAQFVPLTDAHSVTLLRKAGMISLGKTATPEFGASAYTPGTNTPWDLTRNAGGSSGGAAAAVAAGLVPVAHGSDGGGSLRIPASVCGVFGFKPSRGRVSNGPLGADVTGLSVQGPISRSVRDAAAMLDAMAKPMPGDPYWAPPLSEGDTFLAAAQREPGRLRIARYADAPDATVDPQCLAAYEHTTRLLLDLGHEIEDIANPFPLAAKDHFLVTWGVQQLVFPVPDKELLTMTRWWRDRGRAATAAELLGALMGMQLVARQVIERLDRFDAVLTPTLGMPPQPLEYFTEPEDREEEMLRQTAFTPFTAAFNITGQPSASLPLYWTPDGLPIGSMITGRPTGEAQLLSLCAQLEAAQPWSHRWPPL